MKSHWLALLGFCCAAALTAAEPYTIAVIPKGTTHEFWKSIHAGAVKAQRELAAEGIANSRSRSSRTSSVVA